MSNYILTQNTINGLEINEDIFERSDFKLTIVSKQEAVENLCELLQDVHEAEDYEYITEELVKVCKTTDEYVIKEKDVLGYYTSTHEGYAFEQKCKDLMQITESYILASEWVENDVLEDCKRKEFALLSCIIDSHIVAGDHLDPEAIVIDNQDVNSIFERADKVNELAKAYVNKYGYRPDYETLGPNKTHVDCEEHIIEFCNLYLSGNGYVGDDFVSVKIDNIDYSLLNKQINSLSGLLDNHRFSQEKEDMFHGLLNFVEAIATKIEKEIAN